MPKRTPFCFLLIAFFISSNIVDAQTIQTDTSTQSADTAQKAPEKPKTAEIKPSDLTDASASSSATEEAAASATTESSSSTKDSKKASEETEEKASGQVAAMSVGPGESPGNQIPGLNSLSASVQPFTGSASVPISINCYRLFSDHIDSQNKHVLILG